MKILEVDRPEINAKLFKRKEKPIRKPYNKERPNNNKPTIRLQKLR